jgi:hypothetical protein
MKFGVSLTDREANDAEDETVRGATGDTATAPQQNSGVHPNPARADDLLCFPGSSPANPHSTQKLRLPQRLVGYRNHTTHGTNASYTN